MTGSPQTRSARQVRKSPQRNNVRQKTEKVNKSSSATRISLNRKSTGKRIATNKPASKVVVASEDVNSNDKVEEVEEVDNNRDERGRQKTEVSSNVEVDDVLEQPNRVVKGRCREKEEEARNSQKTRESAQVTQIIIILRR
jgi:hypothetical protein